MEKFERAPDDEAISESLNVSYIGVGGDIAQLVPSECDKIRLFGEERPGLGTERELFSYRRRPYERIRLFLGILTSFGYFLLVGYNSQQVHAKKKG